MSGKINANGIECPPLRFIDGDGESGNARELQPVEKIRILVAGRQVDARQVENVRILIVSIGVGRYELTFQHKRAAAVQQNKT